MGLLNNITKMRLGFQGKKPQFNNETKDSTLHNQSSNLGVPSYSRNPSILDENDSNNTNKYKSGDGNKYMDNLPE